MNKLMLIKGRATACLMLMCLLLAQGCRKDLLQPNSADLQNGLSIAEARQYFETNVKTITKSKKIMGAVSGAQNSGDFTLEGLQNNKLPLWDYAYEKTISKGRAVKIPIDFGRVYAMVNPKNNAIVPLSSLNYLLMYKDSLQAVHTEWVALQPDSAWLYGNRGQYTGK